MSIKAIDSLSVHRLTSGQVVIDLQTAVKELVENSLDANATIIDLATVQTYGFRGEALSSLCTLCSSLTVVTATGEQAPIGTILEFNQDGKLKTSRSKTARNKGTTVTVSELFRPLPVRRKEFERNIKREFAKALSTLHGYALVPCTKENNGVRLVVTNQIDKGSRSVQLQTDGSSLKASVLSLWGPRSLDNILDLDLTFTVEINRSAILKKRGFQQNSIPVKVQGLISKFSPGCGRTNTDRQFFFVNGRPCNLNKTDSESSE
ncbi:hypothetical protein Clacol_000509 [Clathrus columnatus]|uniref:Uncharacterized protein n=1 Tax=Clathrus columnatus TaxID=1419009 RepID=A0AAV4ZYP7_9AGAM|nr:hypothetical protein Clacol_000509 [Clathrus columnatus]